MRLAWLSPLPPASCRSARASSDLLPAVARHRGMEVTAWTPTSNPPSFPGVEVRSLHWSETLWGELSAADLLVYHLSSEPELHGMIWDLARRRRGVVVLHDSHLGELVRVVLTTYLQCPLELHRLVEREMGAYGRYLTNDLLSHRLSGEEWDSRLDLSAAVTEEALLVIVDTPELRQRLAASHPEVHVLDPRQPEAWAAGLADLVRDPPHLLRRAAKRSMKQQLQAELAQWPPGRSREDAADAAERSLLELFP